MRKGLVVLSLVGILGFTGVSRVQAQVWGVNPLAVGAELINLDPFTGAILTSFSLASTGITTGSTEIGLAGWADNELFYTNADVANGMVYVLDPSDGSTLRTFAVSAGWEIDGLGYWSDGLASYLYTSGCTVDDMHRYGAVDGASPTYYWSNANDPRAVAGDYGGKIFTYADDGMGYGIYEVDPVVNTDMTWFAASPSADIVGMAYDGMYLYLSDANNRLYTMDNSGTLLNTLDMDYTLFALGSTKGTGEVVSAPEPASALLLGSGLLSLLGVGVRRRNRDRRSI